MLHVRHALMNKSVRHALMNKSVPASAKQQRENYHIYRFVEHLCIQPLVLSSVYLL